MISTKHLILITCLVCLFNKTMSQTKPSVHFASYNSIGIVAGKSPVAYMAQTVNGLKFNSWFLGAGFGIDNYFIKTLPLFGDLKKEFVFKKVRLFLYADAGGQFITKDRKKTTGLYVYTTQGNLYLDGGLGVTIKTGKRNSIFFCAGNTFKKITQTDFSTDTGIPYKNENIHKLNTISIKIGYQF